MNTLLLEREGRSRVSFATTATTAHGLSGPVPWYSTMQTGTNVMTSSLQIGQLMPVFAAPAPPPQQLSLVTEVAAKKKKKKKKKKLHCWEGYERVPGSTPGAPGSCRKKGEMSKSRSDAAAPKGIYKKGADADGDGKTGEGKKKVTDFSDRNGNGKPDAFEKSSSSSEYDSGSESEGEMNVSVTESSSDDDGPVKKKRSNASSSAEGDCGCGCGGDPKKKKSDCDGGSGGLTKTISKAAKAEKKKKNGVIHRANDGKHDYYVYWKGKKISFGDASMPNRNHNDKARANFNSRHNCAEKHDKSKAGYWGKTIAS